MNQRIFRIIVACVLVAMLTATASAQSALITERITIPDGDSAVVTPVYPSPKLSAMETAISAKYADRILSSTLLRALDIQNYEKDVRDAMRENSYGLYTDIRIRKPYNCFQNIKGFYTWDGDFYTYACKMIKIKKVRAYIFSIVSDMLAEFTAYYPKDFKTTIIKSLEEIQEFMDAMPHHSYKVEKDEYGFYELYVDGRKNDIIPGTINGFILRRILINEVPAAEIKDFVNTLLKTLKGVRNGTNPDILYKVTINDELNYCLTSSGAYFQPKRGGNKVNPSKDPCNWYLWAQCVTVVSDNKVNYYKIRNGDFDENGDWTPWRFSYDINELLIDSKCELIYER